MTFEQVNEGMKDARTTLNKCDTVACDLADMLIGRLRNVTTYRLKKLKKELSQFNAATGKWSN